MNKDIYKKGLIVLSAIVIVLITVAGYELSKNNDNSDEDVVIVDTTENKDDNISKELNSNDKIEKLFITVDISGAVKNPGVYTLEDGKRLCDVIEAAGGLTDEADNEYISMYINKAGILNDEDKIYIPKISDKNTEESSQTTPSYNNSSNIDTNPNNASSQVNSESVDNTSAKININTATKEQLMTLKGIGETYSQRIIDYRNKKKFSSIEEIKNVKGIGEKTFEKIKDRLTV